MQTAQSAINDGLDEYFSGMWSYQPTSIFSEVEPISSIKLSAKKPQNAPKEANKGSGKRLGNFTNAEKRSKQHYYTKFSKSRKAMELSILQHPYYIELNKIYKELKAKLLVTQPTTLSHRQLVKQAAKQRKAEAKQNRMNNSLSLQQQQQLDVATRPQAKTHQFHRNAKQSKAKKREIAENRLKNAQYWQHKRTNKLAKVAERRAKKCTEKSYKSKSVVPNPNLQKQTKDISILCAEFAGKGKGYLEHLAVIVNSISGDMYHKACIFEDSLAALYLKYKFAIDDYHQAKLAEAESGNWLYLQTTRSKLEAILEGFKSLISNTHKFLRKVWNKFPTTHPNQPEFNLKGYNHKHSCITIH